MVKEADEFGQVQTEVSAWSFGKRTVVSTEVIPHPNCYLKFGLGYG